MIFSALEWKQAARNIFRNKRRSLITALAITAGFTGLAVFGGYVLRVERYCMVNTVYINHIGHVQIHLKDGLEKYFSKPSKYLITSEYLQSLVDILSERDEIEFFSPYLMSNGLIQAADDAFAFQGKGITKSSDRFVREHPMVKRWTPELVEAMDGTPLADSSEINPVRLTYRLWRSLKNNPEVSLQGMSVDNSFNALDATVTSRYTTGFDLTEDTSLITTLEAFQELMASDGVTYVSAYLHDDLKARSFAKDLNEIFLSHDLPLEAYPFQDERIGLFYTGSMNFLYAITLFFFLLVSVVVILSVTNAISMSIMERIKELGAMRAIGYTPERISKMLAMESFILSMASVSVGFILSQLLAFIIKLMNIRFVPPGIAGEIQYLIEPWPSLCLVFAVPLVIFSTIAAFIVCKRKVRGEVSQLLTESST